MKEPTIGAIGASDSIPRDAKIPIAYGNLPYVDGNIELTLGTSKEKVNHPTQKPLELLKYLVKTYTNENDWVLDDTCGSNTTGIACYDLNRNYIGIEKDFDIYNVAKKRVEKKEEKLDKQLIMFKPES